MTKRIYILLSKSTTFASMFIHYLTNKPYTHSSLSLVEDLSEMYSFCRIYPRLALPAGFAKENLYKGFYVIHPRIPCQLYEIEVTDIQYQMVQEALDSLYEKRRLFQYDVGLGGSIDYLLKKGHRVYNKRYCSWFIAELLGTLGIVSFDKPYSLVEPIDFSYLENCHLIFEGSVEDLRKNRKECYNETDEKR